MLGINGLRGPNTLGRFSANFNKGDNFCDFRFSLACKTLSEKVSTLREKNLLPSKFFSFRLDAFFLVIKFFSFRVHAFVLGDQILFF